MPLPVQTHAALTHPQMQTGFTLKLERTNSSVSSRSESPNGSDSETPLPLASRNSGRATRRCAPQEHLERNRSSNIAKNRMLGMSGGDRRQFRNGRNSIPMKPQVDVKNAPSILLATATNSWAIAMSAGTPRFRIRKRGTQASHLWHSRSGHTSAPVMLVRPGAQTRPRDALVGVVGVAFAFLAWHCHDGFCVDPAGKI